MPTEIAKATNPTVEVEYGHLSAMTTEQLRKELTASLEMTAANLMRLALIVRTLEERGEDLSNLRLGIMGYLRQIAYGQVLPSVVVRFGGSPTLVRTIAALPMPEQRELAEGRPVPMTVADEGGHYTTRMADPLKMSAIQVRQVFGPGRIRDEAEQILVLSGREKKVAVKSRHPRGMIIADAKRGGLRIGRTFVPTATLVEALGSLRDEASEDDEAPASQAVIIKLTEREHYRLKRAALDGGNISMNTVIRRALLLAGLLSGPDPE